jgi:hypothetical protein
VRTARLLPALLLAPLLALAGAPPAGAEGPSDAEAKHRQGAAADLVAFAEACAKLGARTAGAAALEEARGLDHLAKGLKAAEDAIGALPAGDPAGSPELEKARKASGKEIAKHYDALAALKHDAKEEARVTGYALRALEWDPSEARKRKVLAAADAASGDPVQAGLLLRGLRRADPEGYRTGKYDPALEKAARKGILLLGTVPEELVAFVSLPRDWKKGGTWPVLVAVDGAGCNFLGCARGFANSRGSRPVIVVAPMTLSNTNELKPASYPAYPKALLEKWNGDRIEFDRRGMVQVISDVNRHFGGEEKVFVTGFSGGGNYCYFKLITDPKGVRGAAPACANFSGMGLQGAEGPGPGGGPPVHVFTGEKDEHGQFTFGKKDSPGIEPQTDNAMETLKRLGFTDVRRTMVKGAGHSPLQEQVWKFVDEVLAAK